MEKLINAIVLIAESLKRIADSMTVGTKSPATPAEEPKTRRSRKADPEPEAAPEAEAEAEEPAAEEEADVTAEEETEEETIKVEDLQALAQKAVKKGRVAEIKVWLSKRKAPSVGTMDPKHYADAKAFLTELAS